MAGDNTAIRVAAMQLNGQPDVLANFRQIRHQLQCQADANRLPQLLVLPECFGCFGGAQQLWVEQAEQPGSGPMQDFLGELAREFGIWVVGGSLPLRSTTPGSVFASSLLFNHLGKCIARYDKIHLFDVDVQGEIGPYLESSYNRPGREVVVVDTPFGRVGMAICYDIRFPELFRSMRRAGAELFVLPAAFTCTTGAAHWQALLRARAIENQCFLIAADQVGAHPNGRHTWGQSMIIDPWGQILAELPSHRPEDGNNKRDQQVGCVSAVLDRASLAQVRRSMPVEHHNQFSCHWRHEE